MPKGRKSTAVIISQIPLVQSGLQNIIHDYFPETTINFLHYSHELNPLQFRQADYIIADLCAESGNARQACRHYYSLLTAHATRCIFFVPPECYPIAVELLMRPGCTLLSRVEPIENIIKAIRNGDEAPELISKTLASPLWQASMNATHRQVKLTISERQVLRLLGKGWCINQIAVMLKKSNKTISAQKNSAMRRLALRSNAEMFAWINSAEGMKMLSLMPVPKDTAPGVGA